MGKGAGLQGTGASEGPEGVLRKTPLFASLTEKELQDLAARTIRKRFQRGELLFDEGDPCTGLFSWLPGRSAFSSYPHRDVQIIWKRIAAKRFDLVKDALGNQRSVGALALDQGNCNRWILWICNIPSCSLRVGEHEVHRRFAGDTLSSSAFSASCTALVSPEVSPNAWMALARLSEFVELAPAWRMSQALF